MNDLKVEYVDISEIFAYPNNAKEHPAEQIEQIKKSIEDYGMNDPIGIWKNEVVEGHGRLIACRELGFDKVPVIRLDHLTSAQRREYMLVHNKLTMNSDFNTDLLTLELEDLSDFDAETYGFEFESEFELELEHEKNREEVQDRVLNIVNLGKEQFRGEGLYDIPILKPVKDLPPIKEWIGFNYVLSDDNPEGKAVHFFIDDYQFERIWANPEKYVEKLQQYVCVAAPDFSPFGDMPHALQIYNHYRKHWVGAWLQKRGVTVIPTIRCSTDERSLDWYLDGEPHEGIVIMSSMWTKDDSLADISKEEYTRMKKVLQPKKSLFMAVTVIIWAWKTQTTLNT